MLNLLADGRRRGLRGVLATITNLTGSGARAIGTHMAVLANGDCAGSFSSGCVEAAIVAEALAVLTEGQARTVRFGQGSPYLDLKLPCGGGMDVLFLPDPDMAVIDTALAQLARREPVSLALGHSGRIALGPVAVEQWGDALRVARTPPLRLILLGHGAEMLTSLRLARSLRLAVELFSPDEEVVAAGKAEGAKATLLGSAASPPELDGDCWTAFLFLFHDHDWEPPLLAKALASDALWIGAMGSPRTHVARQTALAGLGLAGEAIARVHGPVGVIPSARDPTTLALSALAEIVGAYAAATQ
ncbi:MULTISPECIES: XdhC family protein [Sphingomonas]|uniref:XdhC family protein n=1 Tax=Sphingomonas TaxID=13687 RepID=UPI001444C711|nr:MULTISPECIES: XdhC family protein [Sphingomonas]